MRFIATIALALLSVSTVAASAQDTYSDSDSGLSGYTGLRGSLAFQHTISGHDNLTPPTSVKANSNVGGGASVYWGERLPYGFKTELELLYRYASLSDGSVNGVSGKLGGYSEMFAPMVNVYWDFPVSDSLGGIHPFIGGGVGYAWNEVGLNNVAGISFPTVHNDDWRLAYNFMAGTSIPLSDSSRFTIMYRWLHEDIGINCNAGIKCSGNLGSQSIDLGFEMDL